MTTSPGNAIPDEIRILLIEDDHVDAVLVNRALRQCTVAFSLTQCESLEEGIRLMAGTTFHAVLVDLSVPDSFGLEGVTKLSSASPDTPVVVLTGLEDDAFALAALEAGAQDYLVKGQTNKDLLNRTLRYAIQRQQITSENRLLMEKLRRMARFDPLTGVLNRHSFAETMETEWSRAQRHCYPLSCVMLDIDFFKQINDTFGHAAGDSALKSVAATIEKFVRKEDSVARYGGEEFCVVLTDTPEEAAATWAERLREALAAKPLDTMAGTIQLTASFGVASRLDSVTSVEDLLERADQALFLAKQMGRDQVVSFCRMQRMMDERLSQLADRFEGVVAREIMSPITLSVEAATPVRDVIADMVQHRIDVAAVIDDQGHLIGRIAENDLVAQMFALSNESAVASDVMQKTAGCFPDDTPMPRICEFFSRAGSARVFVVRDHQPLGVISCGNVLRWLCDLQTALPDDPVGPVTHLLDEIYSEAAQLRALLEHETAAGTPETVQKVTALQNLVDASRQKLTS